MVTTQLSLLQATNQHLRQEEGGRNIAGDIYSFYQENKSFPRISHLGFIGQLREAEREKPDAEPLNRHHKDTLEGPATEGTFDHTESAIYLTGLKL